MLCLQIKQGIFASYYQIFLQVQAPLVPAQLDQFQDLSRDLTPPLAPVSAEAASLRSRSMVLTCLGASLHSTTASGHPGVDPGSVIGTGKGKGLSKNKQGLETIINCQPIYSVLGMFALLFSCLYKKRNHIITNSNLELTKNKAHISQCTVPVKL